MTFGEGDLRDRFLGSVRDGPAAPLFFAICAVLALALYAEFVWHPGRMLFGTDMLGQGYQLRRFFVEEVLSGRGIPSWNPYLYTGHPFLGILPGPVFYPTTVLYFVLPLFRAIGWTFVLHSALAGGLAYLAARSFGLERWPSAVTGLAFMFTGYLMSFLYGGHDGRMFAMALIPGALACLETGLREERPRAFLGLALVVALQIYTPHAQVMYFSSLVLSLYLVYRLAWMRGDGVAWSRLARLFGGFAGAFVLAALLGAAQLVPAADLLRFGVRGAGQSGYEFAASWALPPQELSAFLLPDLVGSLDSYWGANPFKLHTEFLGAAPLALALVGAVGGRRDRRVWFLGGASLLGVAFALGDATPVHRIAYRVVPLVDRFRAPAMMLAPVALLVTLLSGFGCQWILAARGGYASGEAGGVAGESRPAGVETDEEATSGLSWGWVWGLSAPFLLLLAAAAVAPEGVLDWVRNGWFPPGWERRPPPGLTTSLAATGAVGLVAWAGSLAVGQAVSAGRVPRWALAAVALLVVVELWRVDARYLETVDPERHFRSGPVIERLARELGPGERVWPLERTFGPNDLMLHRIPAVSGNLNFRLRWYDRLTGGPNLRDLLQHPTLWPLFDLQFLTTRSRVQTPLLEEAEAPGDVRVYRVTRDAPHAFFPGQLVTVHDLEAARSETRGLADPGAAAVVEVADGARRPRAGAGQARVVHYEPDRVVLEVDARRRGLLFVSEAYHPYWQASVDGRPTRVYRTNTAFRGVSVPEGRHEVEFVYSSPSVRWGIRTSLLSVVGLIVAVGGMRFAGPGSVRGSGPGLRDVLGGSGPARDDVGGGEEG